MQPGNEMCFLNVYTLDFWPLPSVHGYLNQQCPLQLCSAVLEFGTLLMASEVIIAN